LKLALGGGDARPRSFWKELRGARLLQQHQHVAAIAEQSLESPVQLEKLSLKVWLFVFPTLSAFSALSNKLYAKTPDFYILKRRSW
jgi:hypothetical protein